ncbi:MAG: cupin domain-containing protein [Pseudomonadota bacterium]
MKYLLAAAILALATPAAGLAGDKIDRLAPTEGAVLNLDELEWFPDPSLPEGSMISLVAGNSGAAEVFMVYVKLPPNTVVPPQTHPYAENVAVLKGRVGNGHGETFDKSEGKMLGAGSTFVLPAGHAHFLWSTDEVIALLTATGPWSIAYVDPSDDPRNQ